MYSNSNDRANDVDRYLELAARIEWVEQGSLERPRPIEAASAYVLAAEPIRG